MHPPAGRVKVGDRVLLPGGGRGTVVAEALMATNGACRYTIAVDGDGTAEHLDFELRPAS